MQIKPPYSIAAACLALLTCLCMAASPVAPAPASDAAASRAQDERHTPFWQPTACAGDIPADPGDGDPDVSIRDDSTVNVMFHGNRFVAARELATEFERLNPGQKVSWTALPPANTMKVLQNGPQPFAGSKPFFPDLFMGNQLLYNALLQNKDASKRKIQLRGSYSRIHGIVLIARADDPNIAGSDIKTIVNNLKVRFVLPGQQPLTHPLVSIYGHNFEKSQLARLPSNPRFGISQQRHHRSIPARILSKCEDVGFQFLQSQPYLEAEFPGKFKFVPVPIPEEEAATEESYLFAIPGGPRAAAAEKFLSFMKSSEAVAILRKYHLEP
jgi:hypothetical protein